MPLAMFKAFQGGKFASKFTRIFKVESSTSALLFMFHKIGILRARRCSNEFALKID